MKRHELEYSEFDFTKVSKDFLDISRKYFSSEDFDEFCKQSSQDEITYSISKVLNLNVSDFKKEFLYYYYLNSELSTSHFKNISFHVRFQRINSILEKSDVINTLIPLLIVKQKEEKFTYKTVKSEFHQVNQQYSQL